MKIIPAIDLIDGKCVRLYKGDYKRVKIYDDNPVRRAGFWEDSGAQIIHLVDLDGAKDGTEVNFNIIKEIRKTVTCSLEIGGGIRSREDAVSYLDIGIDRIILGTSAVTNPELVHSLARDYPGRIIVGADAKNGKISVHGWQEEADIDSYDFAASFNNDELAGILFTDIDTDGTLSGPNIRAQREMGKSIDNPLIASGGISSLEDLKTLAGADIKNLWGVVVGIALYEKKFTLQDAITEVNNAC